MKIKNRILVTILYPPMVLIVFFLFYEVMNSFMFLQAPTKDTMFFYGFAFVVILAATIILGIISFLFDLLTFKIQERKIKAIAVLFIYILCAIRFSARFGSSTYYLALFIFLLLSITYWLTDEWMKTRD